MATIPVQFGRAQPGGPSVQFGGAVVTQAPSGPPAGSPVLPGIAFRFASAIVATGLSITVKNLTTSAMVSGTTSYNATTRLATWTAAGGSPLIRGVRYQVTVSGATATDGTPMVPQSFVFTVGASLVAGRYVPRRGRLHA